MKWLWAIFIIASCTRLPHQLHGDQVDAISENNKFHIHFSHNINGETHPCGCRHFPLGGLPQVAGIMSTWNKDQQSLYVDTGDTLFASTKIPSYVQNSQEFTAKKIAEFLTDLKLSYMVLGDQDFALGIPFLQLVATQASFKYLLTNANDTLPLPYTKFVRIVSNSKTQIFLLGVTSPTLLSPNEAKYFSSPEEAIKLTLEKIKSEYSPQENDRFILLSHSGMDQDKRLANLFPEFSWIIGAHTQSFLRIPEIENKSSIVQVLSRNHYIGKIELDLTDKERDQYLLQEVSDEWQNKISPNPFTAKLESYKTQLMEIQKTEQSGITAEKETITRYPTVRNCQSCHTSQTEFWSGTAHSLAYLTLMKSKAQHNGECLGCHTLFYNDPRGFNSTQEMTQFSETPPKNYWNYVSQFLGKDKSVRNLASSEIKKISRRWENFDQKSKTLHQNANVQCLNCHDQHPEHPFQSQAKPSPKISYQTCLKCHTQDQSPAWYNQDGTAKEKHLATLIKKIACPKN